MWLWHKGPPPWIDFGLVGEKLSVGGVANLQFVFGWGLGEYVIWCYSLLFGLGSRILVCV